MTVIQSGNPDWSFKPAWSVLSSREEFGGDGALLSLSATHGIRERVEGEGRAASEDTSGYRVVAPGDIVINRLVARDGAISLSPLAGKISPAYWVLRTCDQVDAGFVSYLLNSSPYLMEIGARSKFMPPAQFDLPWDQFRTLPIACPPLPTQRAIADYLDAETARIDALIAKKQRMVELTSDRLDAVIQEEVLGYGRGDCPSWAQPQLRYVARFSYGDPLAAEDRCEGDVRVFGSNGPVGFHDRPNTRGPVLVVGRKGSHGKVQYSPEPIFAIDTTYFVDSSLTGHHLRWLYYGLLTLDLSSLSQDVGVPGLSREAAYSQRITCPPLKTQRAIADYLDVETARIDALIAKNRRQIALLRERRQALITAAVTGELEISEVAV